jgi:hypothetical protein
MMRAIVVLGVVMSGCGGKHVTHAVQPPPATLANSAIAVRPIHRPSTPVPVVLAERDVWAGNLIADETGLYWTETNGPAADVWFVAVPRDDAAPRSAWHLEDGTIRAIALDAESIYIAFSPTHGLMSLLRRSKRGGSITTLATDIRVLDDMKYADGAIYVASGNTLTSYATDGSRSPQELARSNDDIHHFEIGADEVFFSSYAANLAHVPKAGGAIQAITLPGSLGFWTVQGHSLYVDLDGNVVRVDTSAAATPAPVPLGANGTVLGIAGDQLIVRTRPGDEQLQGLSLETGTLTAPVAMGMPWEGINVSAGAVWWMHKIRDSHDEERYQLLMYVP